MEQQEQLITKNTTISDVLLVDPKKAPLLTEIMMQFGIHCVGCGAASFETLEQGVLGHGFTEDELNKLVSDLNKALGDDIDLTKEENSSSEFKLTFTDKAISKLKEAIKSQNKKETTTLKVSILAGGCSGFLYNMEFMDEPSNEDLNFKQDGINIAVDKKSMDMLNGIEIDFIDTLNESGFKFNNPNQSGGCGCGKSFN